MENSTILTAEGAQKLEEQLEYLKTVARKEIAQQIKVAREFGDLSENAEYDEAKNEQARIEGEIVELEKKVAAEIIDSYGQVTAAASADDPTVCEVEFSFAVAHGLNQIYLTAHITV